MWQIVCSHRPLVRPWPPQFVSMLALPRAHHLTLDALTDEDTIAMTAERFGVKDVPALLGKIITNRSRGVRWRSLIPETARRTLGFQAIRCLSKRSCSACWIAKP